MNKDSFAFIICQEEFRSSKVTLASNESEEKPITRVIQSENDWETLSKLKPKNGCLINDVEVQTMDKLSKPNAFHLKVNGVSVIGFDDSYWDLKQ